MVGWVTQMIIGVAFWMFPKYTRERPRGSEALAWITYVLLNVGLLLRAIAEPANVPLGFYRRDSFLVLGAELKWHRAELYRVVRPEGPFPVSKRYLEYMIIGATEHGLSAGYIKQLKTLRA